MQTAYSKFDKSVCTCFVLMWNLSNVNERRFHSVKKILFHIDVRIVKLKKNYLQNFLGGFVFNDPVQLTVMVAPLCGVRPFPGLMTSFFTPSAILSISLWTIPVFLANSQCRFQGQPSCALCALLFKALSDPTEKKSRKVSRESENERRNKCFHGFSAFLFMELLKKETSVTQATAIDRYHLITMGLNYKLINKQVSI